MWVGSGFCFVLSSCICLGMRVCYFYSDPNFSPISHDPNFSSLAPISSFRLRRCVFFSLRWLRPGIGFRLLATHFFVFSNKKVSKKMPPQAVCPSGTRTLVPHWLHPHPSPLPPGRGSAFCQPESLAAGLSAGKRLLLVPLCRLPSIVNTVG